MAEIKDNIVYGPRYTEKVYHCSLAEFLIPKLKSHPKDCIIQVNGDTGESLTARDVLEQSLKVTAGLTELGIKQKDVAAFVGRNTTNSFIAGLGVLWHGATVAPFDATWKPLELSHVFNITKPKIIFCEDTEVDTVLQVISKDTPVVILNNKTMSPPQCIKFNDILRNIDVDSYQPLPVDDPAENLAFIACSSGTTGFPKGVALTHKSMVYQIPIWVDYYDSPFFHLTTFFWITCMIFLLLSVSLGTKRIFLRQFNSQVVLKTIQKYKPKILAMAPADLYSLINDPTITEYDLSSVTAILTPGAPVTQDFIDNQLKKAWRSPVDICQCYGMTEASGILCNPTRKNIASVGQPCHGFQCKVVDPETGKGLGPNENGELWFKAYIFANGYIENEEATKSTFDEDGWLHTGDLGYYDKDGYIYVVDKVKEIVKYKAWHISPLQLEAVIVNLPGVRQVAVTGIPHDLDGIHLMALVVKDEASTITKDDIIKYVEDNMADHKRLRAGVEFVDSFPRTSSGKVKRLELKKLAIELFKNRN